MTFTDGEMGGLDELGMSSVDLNVSVPLQSLQDTVSGLSIVEPEIEGLYDIKMTGTISRHTSQVYQGYRDTQEKLIAYMSMHQGWYMQDFIIKEIVINNAGPDDGAVAQEPLDISAGFVCEEPHAFTPWLEGVTEVQKSPVVFRMRDFHAENEMVRY